MYIHERDNWTDFRWDMSQVSLLQEKVFRKQGLLYGRLSSLRKLGIENVKDTVPSHYVDSVVGVMLEAVQHYDMTLSKEKLCAWQAAFFPTGYSDGSQIEIGQYRTNEEHIVSGMFGREKIHYIAPSPERVEEEMGKFLIWFDGEEPVSSVIRSAIAHFWFVSIHPFEDGNGRLARILSDMLLARGEKSEFRFYNVSSQINKDKNHYYEILERMQHGDGDITEWLVWYMTWATLAKCSKDTAIRDIQDLVEKNILIEDIPGAKRPSYSIVYDSEDLTQFFSDVSIVEENGIPYLKAIFKGKKPVSERLLKLDAERFKKGD